MPLKIRPKLGRPALTVPVYRRIADVMRARLAAGDWPLGEALPSFQSFVREYGVGERIVRTAIESLKREGWLVVNAQRRIVVTHPTGSATTQSGGVVLEILHNKLAAIVNSRFSGELQRGISMGVSELDAPLLIAHDGVLRQTLPTDLLRIPLRGIVLLWPSRKEMLPAYENLRVPVVLVDRPFPGWKLHAASVDNFSAAKDATNRLIAMGHKRIAFLSYLILWRSEPDPDAVERREGFVSAMKAARLYGKGPCVFQSSDYDTSKSSAIQAILVAKPPITAVLATSPSRAELLMRAARESGRKVPENLSIVCFQGQMPEPFSWSGPQVNFAELARRGTLLLNEPRLPGIHLRVPTHWNEGKTAQPPAR